MLEQAVVLVRRANQDRHLVERHSPPRLGQDATRDLHAFPPLARRREECHRVVFRPHRRRLVREEVGAKALEVRRRGRIRPTARFRLHPRGRQPPQHPRRVCIVRGHGREHLGARVDQCPHELFFAAAIDRHIQQHQRRAERPIVAHPFRSRGEESRAIRRLGIGELPLGPLQQEREIGSRLRRGRDDGGTHPGSPKLRQRLRKRAGKPRSIGNLGEIGQRPALHGIERGARRDRDAAERGGRRDALPRQPRGGDASGQLRQADTRETDRRATLDRDRAREVVSRAAGGRDDGDRLVRGESPEERGRGLEPYGRGVRFNDV